MIVVTSHDDRATQKVARKHGAICVQTDLFSKNGRHFNKGAAINAGFGRFQYHGWRLHLDSDIILPDNFRRVLFNHTHLDPNSIYGADRIDVIGLDELQQLRDKLQKSPQAAWSFLLNPANQRAIGSRYVDTLRGYVPIGFFQLWHASTQKELSVVARHRPARRRPLRRAMAARPSPAFTNGALLPPLRAGTQARRKLGRQAQPAEDAVSDCERCLGELPPYRLKTELPPDINCLYKPNLCYML